MPWVPAIVVLAIAVAAALVLALSIQPSTTPPSTTHAEAIGAGDTAVWTDGAPKNRSRAFLATVRGEAWAAAMQELHAPARKSARTPWLSGGSDGEASR